MGQVPPGQRAAQTPSRAAVAAAHELGKAHTAGGSMATEMVVVLRGQNPYRITVGEDGGEVRTCLVTGATTPEGRKMRGDIDG